MSKVSVIIPVYNAEKHILRCLESLKIQSLSDFEVLIINDGSSDSSAVICENFCLEDNRFKVINQTNAGPSAARNTGISRACSKYLYFVDSDDYIEPNTLELLFDAAEENNADITVCNFLLEYPSGKIAKNNIVAEGGLYEGNRLKQLAVGSLNMRTGMIPPYSWIRLVKRELLTKNALQFDTSIRRSEDFLLWSLAFFKANRVFLLPDQYLYHYVEVSDSITHNYISGYWGMVKRIYSELKSALPNEKSIQRQVDIVLFLRAYTAMNIAVFTSDKKQFLKDIKEITKDPLLRKTIRNFSIVGLEKTYRKQILPLKLHLYVFIRLIFYLKYRKNH